MARRRRRRLDPLRPLSEAELYRQANLLLTSALSRPKAQIRREQAEARRQAEADARSIQGFTTALAQIVGAAGPAVDKVYADATNRQQQIAQGFSQQQQQQDQAAAARANALIQSQGGARRIDPGTGSQVTYAVGGMVPSNLLNETGAAMSSVAHGYGAGVAGRGQQQLMSRQAKAQQEQAKLREMMEELMSRVPGLRQEILDKLYQREIGKAATGIQRDYLGLAGNREMFDQSLDLSKLDLAQQSLKQKQAGKQGEALADARAARMDALAANKEKAWAFANTLGQGKPDPNNPMRTVRPTPQQAYSQLWSRYGQGLMRYAPKGHRTWWKRQIDAMIWNALTNNGFKKPPKSPPVNRKITRPGPS